MARLHMATSPLEEFARLEPALRRYFRRAVDAHEVDDLVQEVFLALQNRRSTEAIENVNGYVFVVAGNVLKRRHSNEIRWKRVQTIDASEELDLISPERAAIARDRLDRLTQLLELMPARTRQIFVLHRFEEMTYPRIAETLDISQSAVEKHMIRALRALHGLKADL